MTEKKQKILVAYFSRTGNTKLVAEKIAKNLRADIDEVIDTKDRKRTIIGWLIAGKDASVNNLTYIKIKKDPIKYDLVVIGTPVWAWTMTPAIRTYLTHYKFNNLAFFCTHGGQSGKTFINMEKLSKKPVAVIDFFERDVKKGNIDTKLKEFCEKI